MSNCARKKSNSGIYHLIIKSPSDIILFKDNSDKIIYLRLLAHYKKLFNFKIYCYCIMDNHAHFIIDECTSNISIFMKLINQSYAKYFNNKYKHTGRIFKNRFFSIPVETDSYIVQLSIYIHNNVLDLPSFHKTPENYPFPTLGIYLSEKKDYFNLIDQDKILSYFSQNHSKAIELYKIKLKNF